MGGEKKKNGHLSMKTLFLASAAAAALFAAPAVAQDAIGSVGVSYANPSIDTDFGDAEADVWTVDGTVALPMNDWTVTLNGSVDYVEAFDESDTSGAAAAHFTRMFAPDVRAGAFAGVSNLGNEELWTAGVEAQKYLAQATLTGQIAYTNADDLLEGLGQLARETGCHVQTHASESDWAAGHVRDTTPDHDSIWPC